jgi:pSer/pThr/pTyr-binding forkhead associated (FHA) protein
VSDTTASLQPVEVEAGAEGLIQDDVEAISSLHPGTALLIVQRGPNAGARFLLDAEFTVAGRSTDADIFLDDVTVSRRHAEFLRSGDQFVVRDVGSLNGTYVNRERVEEAILRADDEVQIGKYRLTFHPQGQAATTSDVDS